MTGALAVDGVADNQLPRAGFAFDAIPGLIKSGSPYIIERT